MPKKSARKKSSHKAKVVSRHFLWSVFFLAMSAAVGIYMVGVAKGTSQPYTWPMIGVLAAAVTIITIGYERKAGKLGTRQFLWSILFAAVTLASTLYTATAMGYEMWSSISAGAAAIALILLVYEKYNR